VHIILNSSLSFWPLNGNLPHKSANKRTPSAQISAGGPEYSILLTISGAIYEGVPQKILTLRS